MKELIKKYGKKTVEKAIEECAKRSGMTKAEYKKYIKNSEKVNKLIGVR